MKIVSIDLATKTGFVIYDYESETVIHLGKITFNGSTHGAKLNACSRWFKSILKQYDDIGYVIVEGVYIPSANENKSTSAFKLLSEYHGVIELICYENDLPFDCVEATSHHISLLGYQSKHWLRKQIKDETVKRVKWMGFDISNDDEADSISLLLYWLKRIRKPLKLPNGRIYNKQ